MGEPLLEEAEGINRDQTRFKEVQAQFHQGLRPIKEWFGEFREEDHAPDPLPGHEAALEAQERALEVAGAAEDCAKGHVIPVGEGFEVGEVPPEVPTQEVIESLPPAFGDDIFSAWRAENVKDHRQMLQCLERMERRLRNAESMLQAHGIRQVTEETLGEGPKKPFPKATDSLLVGEGGGNVPQAKKFDRTKKRVVIGGLAATLLLGIGVPSLLGTLRRPSAEVSDDPSVMVQKGLQGMADYVRQETSELQAMVEIPKAAGEYLGTLEEARQAAPEAKKGEIGRRIEDQKAQLERSLSDAEEAIEGLQNLARVSGLSGPKTAVEIAPGVPVKKGNRPAQQPEHAEAE